MRWYLIALILSVLVLIFGGCNIPEANVWVDVCVDADKNLFRPNPTNFNDNYIAYRWRSHAGTRYDVGFPDQEDLNKMPGVTFTLFDATECSFIVGWKYDIPTDAIEISPYFHIDGETYNVDQGAPDGSEIWGGEEIQILIGEEFETHINVMSIGEVALTLITPDTTIFYSWDFGPDVVDGSHRETATWFGGTSTPSHPVCIERMRID